ncbi:hypothetical protein [Yellowstone lake phycodnavirus 2]|jgi:hypothetical protein|uniref:hypothetical protein n=1 Tax=Yellowstone lake phycodnavirus 2 TaxID=1586714 RepID=UPI0006EBB993|nr:hypothetical protein AR678_gp211 [Yellowstone lake phycodnavirus 2]BAT22485.1 hypothetical protein [Yellowstone lake phycodnavirus 2]
MGSLSEFERHVFRRLDNLEAELNELRGVTWPVCQGLIEERSGSFQAMKDKRRFFKFIHVDDIMKLLKSKARFMRNSQDLVYEELRQVRVEIPRVDEV